MDNTEKQKVRLTICGVEYVLLSAKEEGYIKELGARLHEAMNQLLQSSGRISATQAAVLCALEAMDEAREAQVTSENLRERIQDYLEDAAQMKREAELARHDAQALRRELGELKKM